MLFTMMMMMMMVTQKNQTQLYIFTQHNPQRQGNGHTDDSLSVNDG
jgi:hypothetical protein